MTKKNITGIQRATQYSPNHIGNDYIIFTGTAAYLKEKGFRVTTITEQQINDTKTIPERVFTMLRNKDSIRALSEWEKAGCKTVNSSSAIISCERENLTNILLSNDIPYPESVVVNTNEKVTDLLLKLDFTDCWIKRGDFHAIHREDVTYARHAGEAQEMLAEYELRGIRHVVISKHLKGDLIKFYGVRDSGFFFWLYPHTSHSKFGLERINGESKGITFDLNLLRDICSRAADVLGLVVYGGDCIVSPDGSIHIIDFNDWPSFSPCRKEAVPAIGDAIINLTFLS
jgi:hypothetical protein